MELNAVFGDQNWCPAGRDAATDPRAESGKVVLQMVETSRAAVINIVAINGGGIDHTGPRSTDWRGESARGADTLSNAHRIQPNPDVAHKLIVC